MAESSVRVNLTVTYELDAVLGELAALTGRGKASYAVEALTWYLPQLRKLLQSLQTSGAVLKPQRESRSEVSAAPRPGAVNPFQRQDEGGGEKLSRKERREAERSERKALAKRKL